jgi:predicted 3-demethylubiquinone-9 3-methyltransferase (glyoxalase superfamily)
MQKITPFLWFDDQAEAAAKFYCSIFADSKITGVTRYGDAGPGPKGGVMICTFELEGQEFIALNGGPHFRFTEAISFSVSCESQAEVDVLWDRLTEEGEPGQCGWLKDKYGLSWQIVPTVLPRMLQDKDSQKVKRVTDALMTMKKIDIATLERAYGR